MVEEKMVDIDFEVSEEVFMLLQKEVELTGKSVSDIVRKVIDEYFEKRKSIF